LRNKPSEETKKSLRVSLAMSLNNIGFVYYIKGDVSKALEYFHLSLAIQEEIEDKLGIASSLNNIGSIYKDQGDISKGLEYLHKSLKLREEIGDKSVIASSLNNIGHIYQVQGDVHKAFEYYHKSIKIREEIEDKLGVAECLNNIAAIFHDQGYVLKALEYSHKSLVIREEKGDKKGIALSLNNIGAIYKNQGDITKALEYYNKSLTIYKEIGSKEGIANSLTNIGAIYKSHGDTSKSLEYHHQSLKIREEITNKKGIVISLNRIAELEIEQGALGSAEKHLHRSLKLARELGSPKWISESSYHLSKLAKRQGKYKLAMQMYEVHIQMRDSINNESTQKASINQEAKYEYEKQKAIDDSEYEKQIAIEKAEHEKTLVLEQEEQKKQRVITYAIGSGLVLVIGFLAFVFNRLRITKKQKTVIEFQKLEVEAQHKEITDSINYAERIQRSFLAKDDLLNDNLEDYFVFFQPKEVVSGDFYWAAKLSNNNFAMVNADSTGHGVPGAIMSILNISAIEKAVEKGLTRPSAIFNDTRKTIIERLKKDGSAEGGKDGMDASIIVFDKENNKFSYTAAQNPIWIVRNKNMIQISPEKMPLGKHDNDTILFVGGEFDTKKGDIVYTLTDGYQDQFGGTKNKKFMVKKMREYILSISHLPMKEQHQNIKDTFNKWKGDLEQIDDVCVIGVKI
jgi:tetratricopeptide (TPR) repeat protein/serine phosphatase RsbU (regulator of sigma subunit)